MKKFIVLFLGIFINCVCATAQTDPRKQYEDFKKRAQESYEDFRKAANKRYSEELKKTWRKYKALPPTPYPKDEYLPIIKEIEKDNNKRRKPKLLDGEQEYIENKRNDNRKKKIAIRHNGEYEELIKDDDGKELKFDNVITPKPIEPQPTPIAPILETPQNNETIDFVFYGTPCRVRYDSSLKFSLGDCDYDNIAEAWERLSNESSNNMIRDCLELRIRLQLSDWAYLNLLNTFAKQTLGDTNEATFLMAFIFCQCGYKMRLAMDNNKLYLLFGSKHSIYGATYLDIDNETFYSYNWKGQQLMICDVPFSGEKPLSLLITSAQDFAYSASNARRLVSKRYPEISASVSVNKNLLDFYNTYPKSELDDNFITRWAMYANTPMEKEVKQSLYPALKQHISGLSEKEAVERLLNWVQTAFVYEYDSVVWGCDRAFFAEETLHYPYSDCEDRSILLTRLVRDLLGLKCILIHYPGHLASAVCFNEQVWGDYILLDGKRFVICDGTYEGASVGETMHGMDNKTATVILLE